MTPRERIIEAAIGLFVRYGYRLTSMDMVGQEAGLTRQAIYHHFETKEALFRAVVESVHRGAHDAAVTAGMASETAGGELADVLTAQTAARWRYFSDRLKGSPHADELLSEHQRQSNDLNQVFADEELRMLTDTIDRFLGFGVELRAGATSANLARCIQIAERGAKTGMADAMSIADLECIVGLLVRGAVASPAGDTGTRDRRSRR
jgi:AcrR family transcriptional regulator